MSDPVSLALAITPLAIEVFKGFRTLNSKLKIFCHYSREVQRVRTRFEAQRDFFLSECEILFKKSITDQSQVETLLESRELDNHFKNAVERLCTYLGTRQSGFQRTFEDLRDAIQDLEKELLQFERIESKRQDGETLKDAIRRLRCRVTITINKGAYNEALEGLKQSNYDLRNMRKHAEELRNNTTHTETVAKDVKPFPIECRQFGKVRSAALAFHEAMITRWFCEQEKHQRHQIRLFTNAEVQEHVKMNCFLLGEWNLSETIPICLDLLSLEVRSTIVESKLDEITQWTSSHREPTINTSTAKRRRVKWADQGPYSVPMQQSLLSTSNKTTLNCHNHAPTGTATKTNQFIDVSSCTLGCFIASRPLIGSSCLGYIDVHLQTPFRHSFYPWSGICNRSLSVTDTFHTAKPLAKLFDLPVDKNFDIIDQLMMAKTMVSTILKFHSTPWLRDWWTLNDIHYLGTNAEMESVLSTLHLGAVLDKKQKQIEQRGPLPVAQATEEDHRFTQRIRNTVLYNLGVGLLQIDRWIKLDPNEVADIDKLATQRSKLGPKYRELVQKCLYCDFGVGADLLKPQLQSAILNKVMRELEIMVSGLRIHDDQE
ncbi:hypothetical protein GGR57DRAFT_476229 [Xylariaceae sp. FL1272]|nr:hypothetical protein GGR57DRAFT_476229 [Xylariaceae sp. FL1272]